MHADGKSTLASASKWNSGKVNCNSEIATVCNAVEGHCLRAKKVVHHHANGRFDWLISRYQSVNPSRKAISILSGKYKRFTFVHPLVESVIDLFV